MRTKELMFIKEILLECNEPTVCRDKKLWKLRIEKALIIIDNRISYMKGNWRLNSRKFYLKKKDE